MENRFDLLAKATAGSISRREAFRRIGKGLAIGVLAFMGLGAGDPDPDNCVHCCAFACLNLDPPPRGHEIAECITQCHETGIASVPDGLPNTSCRDFGICT